jgi:hypothetical protein
MGMKDPTLLLSVAFLFAMGAPISLPFAFAFADTGVLS